MALIALNAILIIGFIGIDIAHVTGLIKEFPTILFYENVIYAFIYGAFTAAILGGMNVYPWLTLYSAFVAGRVSRSIISPYGVEKLAMQHVPLLFLLLADAILAALLC
ncbi:hypothetical protein IPA_08375 [Ignicoccus pacificus DSM 13166]|uniref:Uncharacterized protein n=1 Tax=Ignicoccus pacificus DSM 13166 TaxID=940294 RepID=A0A977KB35_9CREN|nr:hypothetical protein IPA_08375 [Ignicoccus pacificus DSM 13166]